jgi:hypothetical protein
MALENEETGNAMYDFAWNDAVDLLKSTEAMSDCLVGA